MDCGIESNRLKVSNLIVEVFLILERFDPQSYSRDQRKIEETLPNGGCSRMEHYQTLQSLWK